MLLLIGVSPLPITALIRAPYLQVVDLQSDCVVRESVAERDLLSVDGADIVTRIDDWLDAIHAEPMATGSLNYEAKTKR